MIPIVYRWDDANAPVARGERRSLCDILYACLVTGYGTKLPAGWTREYVNATFDKAVFRNNPVTGTGFYLQVDGITAATAYGSKIAGYEIMTDVDTGLLPFDPLLTYPQTVSTSDSASTTARPWVLIADDRSFYFFCWYTITTTPTSSNNDVSVMSFGDCLSAIAPDPSSCHILGIRSGYQPFGVIANADDSAPPYTITTFNIARKRDQTPDGISVWCVAAGPGSCQYSGTQGPTYSIGGPLFLARPHINEGTTYSFRGFLPGYYTPCHANAFGQLQTVPYGGKNYLSVRLKIAGSALGNVFISLDDWRAA